MAILIDLSDERFPKEPGNECRKFERGIGVAEQYGVENFPVEYPRWRLISGERYDPRKEYPRGGWVAGRCWFPNIELAAMYDYAIRAGHHPPVSYVYFIQRGVRGPVKIGWAKKPEKRLRELQTGASGRLQLLVKVPGGQQLEHQYHREFAEHRLQGKWFEWCPPIRQKIEQLRKEARR